MEQTVSCNRREQVDPIRIRLRKRDVSTDDLDLSVSNNRRVTYRGLNPVSNKQACFLVVRVLS